MATRTEYYRERVAQAIYGANAPVLPEGHSPVPWENASEAVRSWVLRQADAAMAAHPPAGSLP